MSRQSLCLLVAFVCMFVGTGAAVWGHLGRGTVAASSLPLLGVLLYAPVVGERLRRTRLRRATPLTDEEFYNQYYFVDGYSLQMISTLRNEFATAFDVPRDRIWPDHRFDGILRCPGIRFTDEWAEDLVINSSEDLGVDPDLADVETVDDFIRTYADAVLAKRCVK